MLGPNTVESTYTTTDKEGNLLKSETINIQKLTKSTQPYQNTITGVTSQNYTDFSSIGHGSIREEDNPIPVTLNGRVLVKVTNENGAIIPGDPLTSSSSPGVAMKATKSGPIVGKALGSYDGPGVGKIITFINVGRYVAPLEQVASSSYQVSGGGRV